MKFKPVAGSGSMYACRTQRISCALERKFRLGQSSSRSQSPAVIQGYAVAQHSRRFRG